jgi:hypothetical protein
MSLPHCGTIWGKGVGSRPLTQLYSLHLQTEELSPQDQHIWYWTVLFLNYFFTFSFLLLLELVGDGLWRYLQKKEKRLGPQFIQSF